MPPLTDLLSTFMPSLAWALLDFVWQGMLVGWGAALLLSLMRDARPQARYLVGCAALLLCVALPLSGVVLRMAAVPEAPANAAAISTMLPLTAGPADAAPGVAIVAADRLTVWRDALQARLPLVLAIWACGAGLLAVRMVLGLAWVRSRSREGRARRDGALQARVTRMAQRFGIGRPVALGIVDDLPSPVTAGWWRPVVLVPAALIARIPPDLLEALIAHELAHIRRHDYLVNLVQSTIEIVLFYHPTVWWLSARVRAEREQIADDLAASMLGEPRRLALALSELDRLQLDTPTLAPAAHGGNLMTRIQRLVRPTSQPLNWKIAVPIIGLAAACAGFYANAAQAPETPSAPTAPAAPVHPGHPHTAVASSAKAAHAAHAAGAAQAAHAGHAAKAARHAARAVSSSKEDSFAIVRSSDNGSRTFNGGGSDWDQVEQAKRSIGGDFIWFRRGGETYVIQDPSVVAKANAAWEPVERLGKQMSVHGDEMAKHGKVMERLGKEMAGASQKMALSQVDHAKFQSRIADLASKQAAIALQIARKSTATAMADGADRAASDREIARLEAQSEQIEAKIEAESKAFEKAAERIADGQMEQIGKQMELAGRPMDELGKKMDALGERMDAESRAAESAVRAVIEDAVSRGLARPAPRS